MLPRFATLTAALGLFVGFSGTTASAASGPVTRTLNRSLPELKFTGVALGDAVDFLRDVSGANIHVNWKALEAAGVSKDAQVNLNARAVSLRKALNMLLSEAGGEVQLAWSVDEGVIEVTTKEISDEAMIVRIYSIEDLLMDIPQFNNAPDMTLNQTATAGGNGSSHGNSSSASSSPFSDPKTDPKEEPKPKSERAEDLMSLIRDTISPDLWVENGGKASIKYYNGSIVVRAPRSVHEAIGGTMD